MFPSDSLNDRAILCATFNTLSTRERELFDERAAIMEFDGGMQVETANREALWDVVRHRRDDR